jgi:hypothetical protein
MEQLDAYYDTDDHSISGKKGLFKRTSDVSEQEEIGKYLLRDHFHPSFQSAKSRMNTHFLYPHVVP